VRNRAAVDDLGGAMKAGLRLAANLLMSRDDLMPMARGYAVGALE
jgi:hypothetical protein